MGKHRNCFKKIGDSKGIFHVRMSTIKDRNGKDLTEAEQIRKGWQEYPEGLYKKGLDDHNGVITHLEPDILECEVKCLFKTLVKLINFCKAIFYLSSMSHLSGVLVNLHHYRNLLYCVKIIRIAPNQIFQILEL